MDRVIYIVDTNVVADYIKDLAMVKTRLNNTLLAGNQVYLCQAVDYEVRRGLYHTNASAKLRTYEHIFKPMLDWLSLTDADWQEAADLWAQMRRQGRQFADTDLLLAAIAQRLDGIVVSADDDFNALPIRHENWRIPLANDES